MLVDHWGYSVVDSSRYYSQGFSMISVTNLAMSYGSRLLFTDVNLTLAEKRRYALVGGNGVGKSTFLKLVTQEEEAAFGDVSIPKRFSVGFLKQDHYLFENTPLREVVLRGKKKLFDALSKKDALYDEEFTDEVAYQIAELEEVIDREGGYEAESLAERLLVSLGIEAERHEEPLGIFSGGYKLRVLLARTLFSNPDVLILDEPTNYLDIVTIEWLERYLKYDFEGLLLFTSHDHAFLNNLSTHILDIDYGEIRLYTGDYENFLKEKALRIEQKEHEKKHVEDKIAKMQAFVDKFRYKPSKSRQAQSREKMIDKLEMPEIEKSSRRSPNFRFEQKRRPGKKIVDVLGVSKSFGEKNVLSEVEFTIYEGDRIALLGPNGVGKSTLLKVMLEIETADKGSIKWGHNVEWGYFAQDPKSGMPVEHTLYRELYDTMQGGQDPVLRAILGAMLFSDDDVNKKIGVLSGGESARLAFAKLMLIKPNLLILDEPTNHFDIESREALKKALVDYPGTVIFVSHDRDFISAVANKKINLNYAS